MANICARCQCLCLIEWEGSYAKHDAIGKKSFERDTHIGCDSLNDQQVTSKSPARLVMLYSMRSYYLAMILVELFSIEVPILPSLLEFAS